MKKLFVLIIFVFTFFIKIAPVQAEEGMNRLYLVPSERIDPGNGIFYHGPLYFAWSSPAVTGSGTLPSKGRKHYGFVDGWLVLADLTQAQHDALILNADVYVFPVNVDTPVSAQDPLRTIFETFNIPTDWLTPSNTYRQFIQQTNGIFEFAGRYQVIAGQNGAPPGTGYLFDTITLSTRYNQFSPQVKTWFDLTLISFGYDPSIIQPNRTVRQMLKAASDIIKTPLTIGGETF